MEHKACGLPFPNREGGSPLRPLYRTEDPLFTRVIEDKDMKTRGPVDIQGVTTRNNTSEDRHCEACKGPVWVGDDYERVARLGGRIESYHEDCFIEEFGQRGAYGA